MATIQLSKTAARRVSYATLNAVKRLTKDPEWMAAFEEWKAEREKEARNAHKPQADTH